MKHSFLSRLAAGAWIAATPLATAGINDIPVRSVASVTAEEVILDVFVDSGRTSLRGFGFQVRFDPDQLEFTSGGRYPGLWFLRGENGVSYPYTDVTTSEKGQVRVVGGRLDGDNPRTGVGGDNLLLATLVFKRLAAGDPQFELGPASPEPYVSFARADGEPLDPEVVYAKPEVQPAPEDSDEDGQPDEYEFAVYGDLKTSNGDTDTDGDGEPDRDEWLRGTDPTDANSRFVLQVAPQPDGSKLVLWTGRFDRVYDLEWSPNLRTFTTIAAGLPGIAPLLERLDELHNGDSEGFYRVKTSFPTLGR